MSERTPAEVAAIKHILTKLSQDIASASSLTCG